MQNSVQTSIKESTCAALNQYYKPETSDNIFDFNSEELDVKGDITTILEKQFEILSEYEKLYEKEFDSRYDEYRNIIQIEKAKYINNKLNILPIRERLSKLDLNKTQMDYDATSLYPSAM